MFLLRRLMSLCLVLTMVMTSGAMAAMRDSNEGVSQIVICTGMGPELILIGADGERVAPAPMCPDCTMVLEAGPLPVLSRALPLPLKIDAVLLRALQAPLSAKVMGPQPRAPPVWRA